MSQRAQLDTLLGILQRDIRQITLLLADLRETLNRDETLLTHQKTFDTLTAFHNSITDLEQFTDTLLGPYLNH